MVIYLRNDLLGTTIRPLTEVQEVEVYSIFMALSQPIQPVTSAYLSSYGSGSGSNMLRVRTILGEMISFEPLTSLGESRYLTHLKIFENGEELSQSDSSQSTVIGGFKLRANVDRHNQNTQDKILAAMELLIFRNEHVLVQFWSPHVVGKQKLLTNIDQPSGVGVIDERLLLYMKISKRDVLVVEDESEEEDLDPIARAFTRGFPEWTCDVTNYLPKYFPQQDSAMCCDLFGYLALPVFDSTTQLCVGVIEILTSSKYPDFAYEVRQVCDALKMSCFIFLHFPEESSGSLHDMSVSLFTLPCIAAHFKIVVILQKQNLTCTRVFDGPAEIVPNEWDKVWGILKSVCDDHGLPLAQTWAVSPFTTFVSHDTLINQCCSSFDTKCIGKICMSTVRLPFYARDKNLWPFRIACNEWHLDSSRGLVGKALSCGSCFCEDVTKLSKEEYPLVHNADMSGLTSCFAILLHSVESKADYVLEFFLPSDMEDVSYVVQTLKRITGVDSGFVLGDTSPMEFSDISDSESNVTDGSHIASSANESIGKRCAATFTHDEEASSSLKKLKIDSDPVPSVTVKVTYEKREKSFIFSISPGLLELKNKVAETFMLEGVKLRLKYWDNDNDLILVACDSDLADLVTSGSNISLICIANESVNQLDP
ncbi:NIN-like protein [Tanacetum coccineum]